MSGFTMGRTGPTTPASAPPSDIYVQLDTREVQARLGLLPEQVNVAARRAAVRTRDWLSTQLVRELSARAAVPQKGLRARFKRRQGPMSRDGAYAVLWIGLNPVPAHIAGTPRQSKKGTRVGKHFFERAFFAHVYGDEQPEKVWRRKSFGSGSGRFPVVMMKIPVSEHLEELLPQYQEAAARKFSERFEHEVEYLLTKGATA